MTLFDRPAKDALQINAIGKKRLQQLADRMGFEVTTNEEGTLNYLFKFWNYEFRTRLYGIPFDMDIEEVWILAEEERDDFLSDYLEVKE